MKTRFFPTLTLSLCLLAATTSTTAIAQTHADSARIAGTLSLRRAETLKWMARHQGDIDRYAEQNRALADRSCDLLFVGSSSVNLWHTIEKDMAPMSLIRRSYGGSTIRDMIYNYDVIARGFNPKAIVLLVNNDISGDATHDLTVGDAYDYFRVFAGLVRRDYPTTPLVVLSITPAPVREKIRERQKRLNSLLEEWAGTTPYVHYIDLTAPMYDASGKLREDMFLDDRLHVNPAGYAEWTKIVHPALSALIAGRANRGN